MYKRYVVLCVYITRIHAEIQIHAVIQQEKYSKYFFIAGYSLTVSRSHEQKGETVTVLRRLAVA